MLRLPSGYGPFYEAHPVLARLRVATLGCGGSPLKPAGRDAGGGASRGTAGLADASAAGGAAGADTATDLIDDGSERDATDSSPDEAEAGPSFDLASLPGLVLWLDAGRGITLDPARSGVVTGWAAQSPKGNDFVAPSLDMGVLLARGAVGGLPAVQFGQPPNMMMTSDKQRAAAFPSGTGDYLIEVVAKWMMTTPGNDVDLFQSGVSGSGPGCFVAALDGRIVAGLRDGSSPTLLDAKSTDATFNDGAFRVVGVRRAATSLEVRVNGAAADSMIDPTVGADIRVPNVGQLGTGEGLSIAEVVVIVGPTSEDDTERLEAHLAEKYGLH